MSAACFHLNIRYEPIAHADRSWSESWVCDSCCERFNLREPAILRARIDALEREISEDTSHG